MSDIIEVRGFDKLPDNDKRVALIAAEIADGIIHDRRIRMAILSGDKADVTFFFYRGSLVRDKPLVTFHPG